MDKPKQYGLIVPGKSSHSIIQSKQPLTVASAFTQETDSDDDDANDGRAVGARVPTAGPPRRQDLRLQASAMAEDPSIYQYDEIYDNISAQKQSEQSKKGATIRQPKYIGKLLEMAERRKRENERRIERQVQKEREAEGDEFADKESFVTSSYKKKLEEMRQLEEEEKRQDYLESIGDVTKQQNLDGFYRHMYEQKILNTEQKVRSDQQMETPDGTARTSECGTTSPGGNASVSFPSKPIRSREYRKRKKSDDNSDDATCAETEANQSKSPKKCSTDSVKKDTDIIEEQIKQHLASNLDADSDFSIDSSHSSDNEDEVETAQKPIPPPQTSKVVPADICETSTIKQLNTTKTRTFEQETESAKANALVTNESGTSLMESNEVAEKSPDRVKIDIWKKRTVGDVYEAAIKRYWERQAIRSEG